MRGVTAMSKSTRYALLAHAGPALVSMKAGGVQLLAAVIRVAGVANTAAGAVTA